LCGAVLTQTKELVIVAGKFTVSLGKIIDEFHLETIYMPKDPAEILIDENDVTRPGLQLMGFYEYFNPERMQIIGKMEFAYLSTIDEETRTQRLDALMSRHIPALIIARELPYFSEMLDLAKKYEVPLLRSKESTSNFISGLIAFLNLNLAPRITRHGVLIEIYGEGVFITGESGVGKSETAIELVKRGHRLVADDAVEIRKVSNISLVGSSPDNIRHFLELRGIGIINARRLFGIGAVKNTEKIELIVEMEQWNPEKIYDRMGVDTQFATILGVKIPMLTIPVKPGRNLAVILEVAAMNNRQKKMGYNAAAELLDQLGLDMEAKEVVKDYDAF
jgi:HPr kinase/phosphorylase